MNKFRNPLTILASTIVAIVLFGFINKSGSNNGILTMRTTEVMNGMYDNSIGIVYEDGKTEKIELEKLRIKDLSANLALINKTLNQIVAKGYKLISTAEGGGDGINMTTYTFSKE
ncbi:MAG: hypothetical protein V4635_04195 [Bacteroidota bacterium]